MRIRQFERRFAEQLGLPPKRFARIVRFNAALKAKMTAPGRLWTDIAHEFGYYDQMPPSLAIVKTRHHAHGSGIARNRLTNVDGLSSAKRSKSRTICAWK
jgi:hypothetical protein